MEGFGQTIEPCLQAVVEGLLGLGLEARGQGRAVGGEEGLRQVAGDLRQLARCLEIPVKMRGSDGAIGRIGLPQGYIVWSSARRMRQVDTTNDTGAQEIGVHDPES